MKHPSFLPSLVAMASCLALSTARADITVNNAGFENGDLSSWAYSGNNQVVYSSSNTHGGVGCVQLTGVANYHPSIYQHIQGLQPNTAYKFVAYGRIGTAPSGTFAVTNYGGGSTINVLVTSSTYQRIEVPFTTGASSTIATIMLGVSGVGTVFGDDFAVVPARPAPASDPTNSANWTLNSNLSDEFSGQTLDPDKWHPYINYWRGGAFPWQSFTSNTTPSGGLLHLKTTSYNLLPNGGFETNNFANWTVTGTASIGQYTSGEAMEWAYGAKLTGATNIQQTVTGLSPNTQYTLAGKFKIGSGGALVSLGADAFGGTAVSPAVLNSTDGDAKSGANFVYVTRSLKFTTGASSTSAVVTITNAGAAGTVYADEVSLVPTGLGLTAGNSFSTASVESLTKPQYGYYEARVKAANGANVSSFWFWNHPETGSGEIHEEIDVCELVGAPTRDRSDLPNYSKRMPITTHYFPTAGGDFFNTTAPLVNVDVAADFHTYGVDWEADAIRFYFDGNLVANFPQSPSAPTANGQTQVRWLDWLTFDTEVYTLYGSPTGTTDFQVDYVRSWTK